MGDFFNIKLKINNREETIQVEKGITFENNGAKYVVDSNGTLKKCDKSNNNNIWTNAAEITLTEYQYSVFRAISDNDGKKGLSQKDIQTAFDQYANGEFKNDIKKELSNGYNIESPELKKPEKQVSFVVKNGNSGAKLTFGITNTTPKVQKKTDSKQPDTYTVKEGDSLGKIAEKFGTTVDKLMKINGIKNPNEIKAGQVLNLSKNSKTKEINNIEKMEPNKVTTKDTIGFLYHLRVQESTDNYKAKNRLGYVGAYQFGEQLMEDLGIYTPKKGSQKNSWQGIFKKNKYGITCLSDFLNSPKKQDKLMQAALDLNWKYITTKKLDKYIGKTINGIQITKSGLLAGAHLVGVGGLEQFLKFNNDVVDGNDVQVSEYLRKFGGFDVKLSS